MLNISELHSTPHGQNSQLSVCEYTDVQRYCMFVMSVQIHMLADVYVAALTLRLELWLFKDTHKRTVSLWVYAEKSDR